MLVRVVVDVVVVGCRILVNSVAAYLVARGDGRRAEDRIILRKCGRTEAVRRDLSLRTERISNEGIGLDVHKVLKDSCTGVL